MKKYSISLLVVLIVFLFQFNSMAMEQPTVSTSNYNVKIEGKLDEPNSNVTLIILDNNNERKYLDQVKTEKDGIFVFEFSLEDGKYTGKVSTDLKQYEINFQVDGSSKEPGVDPSKPANPGAGDGGGSNIQSPVDTQLIKEEIRKSFNDIENHWAKNEIELLAGKGIIFGIGDNFFKPEDKITRAQFATLIFNLLDLNTDNYIGKFSDVKEKDWFSIYVEAVAKEEIVLGTEGFFNPNKEITREEMAVIVIRVMEYRGVILDTKSISFVDKENISSWALDSVGKACEKGIIKGMTETTFEPKLNATRAQAAVVIFKLMEVL